MLAAGSVTGRSWCAPGAVIVHAATVPCLHDDGALEPGGAGEEGLGAGLERAVWAECGHHGDGQDQARRSTASSCCRAASTISVLVAGWTVTASS